MKEDPSTQTTYARPIAMQKTYEQPEDSDGRINESTQYLNIKTCDAGGGNYVVIETERWALDEESIDAFAEMLKATIRECRSIFDDDEDEGEATS